MPANRYWNRKIVGMVGAGIQLTAAVSNMLLDKMASSLMRSNLGVVGKAVVIQRGVLIRYPQQIELGDHVNVGRRVEFSSEATEGRLVVGAGTWIGRDSRLDFTGGITIGRQCTVSENVSILTHDHGLNPRSHAIGRTLNVGDRAWLGANSVILPGVCHIGKDSIVGAGAIVTKAVPEGVIVAGNPARAIGAMR